MVTRWGNDAPEYRELSSKMLTTFLLTMRATPYYYNGDELGMTNIKFDSIDDYRDIETINMYKHISCMAEIFNIFWKRKKFLRVITVAHLFSGMHRHMQALLTGTPWIKVNPNYTTINAEAQEKDDNSCLNYFRKLIRLRKQTPTLIYGKYTLLDKDNPKVYAYTREMNEHKILVLLNFSKDNASPDINIKIDNAKVLICNYTDAPLRSDTIILRPYEAAVYQL